MIDYENMSKSDINKAVADKLGVNWQVCALDENEIYDVNTDDIVDYCNDPSDMWPVIQNKGISIIFDGFSNYTAFARDWEIIDSDKNPLRAAAIVFLKMEV